MSEKGQGPGAVNYAILGVVIISLLLSGVSIAIVSGITVPENPATKDDVTGLKDKITELKSDLEEIRTLVSRGGGEVVVEDLQVPWCKAGEPSSIKVVFKNSTSEEGTKAFSLTVAGEAIDTIERTLPAHTTDTAVIDVKKDAGGNYPVSIGDKSDVLVVMNTPPTKYESAAISYAEEILDKGHTVLSPMEEKRELLWFAHAAKPYRGTTIKGFWQPYAEQKEKVWSQARFENLTGIKMDTRFISGNEKWKAVEEYLATGYAPYDFFTIDTETQGEVNRKGGMLDLTTYRNEQPKLSDPWYDYADVSHLYESSNPWGNHHLAGLPYIMNISTFPYRKDWITPEAQAEFKKEYGYRLPKDLAYGYCDGWPYENWTWKKAIDIINFFHNPDEGRYGTTRAGKMGGWMIWEIECGMDVFGVGSQFENYPKIPLSKERDIKAMELNNHLWETRPYVKDAGVGFVKNTPVGALVEHGGNTNGEAFQDLVGWEKVKWKLGPPEYKQYDRVEAATHFGTDGKCFTTGPKWWGNMAPMWGLPKEEGEAWTTGYDLGGKIWSCPNPRNMGEIDWDNDGITVQWREGMGTQLWDQSSYCIPAATDKKPQAWLFSQFTTSKAVDLQKQIDFWAPVRYSTMEGFKQIPDYEEQNRRSCGILDQLGTTDFLCGQDTTPSFWDRGPYSESYEPFVYGWKRGWSNEKTATLFAIMLEKKMETLGVMDKDLRAEALAMREPWRPPLSEFEGLRDKYIDEYHDLFGE